LDFKGQEYTTKYRLEYQREDNGRWFRYKNHNRSEVGYFKITTFFRLTQYPTLSGMKKMRNSRWLIRRRS